MPNTLFLRLEGPLQSWGERARWSIRDTAPEPTKSGVVGLLGCALGWESDDSLRELSDAIRIGVRCDRPGTVLVDYHTVSGGVMSAEGKVKRNATTHEPETVVSYRAYLCDASFLVAVESGLAWIERLEQALQAPVWPVYLGRKSCPPSRPVLEGVGDFPGLKEALSHWPLHLRMPGNGRQEKIQSQPNARVRLVLETSSGNGSRRRDATGRNSLRVFFPRYTHDVMVDLPVIWEEV